MFLYIFGNVLVFCVYIFTITYVIAMLPFMA